MFDTENTMPKKRTEIILRGDRYRQTHKASVVGILGSRAPKVVSKGHQFYNRDEWRLRFLVDYLCRFAQKFPGRVVTRSDIATMVGEANYQSVGGAEIVIAHTPDKLPQRLAMALTGGAYHEAWHTLYSCRRKLAVDEIADIVLPRWAKVANWAKYQQALLQWSNIIEDIRIERLGRGEFAGTYIKMCDLQDFILDQEDKGRTVNDKRSALSIIAGVFRDLGLGYNTDKQRQRLEQYKAENADAVEFVVNGPLSPYLKESIALSKNDDTGSFRIALDVVAILAEFDDLQDSQDQSQQGQPGDGEQKCPGCGAPSDKLIVRPKPHHADQGIVTCTVCGFQAEVKLESGQGQGQDAQSSEDGQGQGQDAQSSEDGQGVGGHEWQDLADGFDFDGETDLLDSNKAFEDALDKEDKKENEQLDEGEACWKPFSIEHDETVFVQPSCRGLESDKRRAERILKTVQQETTFLRSRLRSILRALEMTSIDRGVPKGRFLSNQYLVDTKVSLMAKDKPTRAYDMPGMQYDTSFAAAVVMDESGSMAEDQLLKEATRTFMAIIEPFDSLGAATLAIGFRNGQYRVSYNDATEVKGCHRTDCIRYDIFKHWNERFHNVSWRFANTVARGGTPMADGIQLALDEISKRNEANRVIFVVTDGWPDSEHCPVIKRQIRLAREAGIRIIGVGLSFIARDAIKMFDDHVWAENVEQIPKLIVEKLNEIVDLSGKYRGRRVKKENNYCTF